MSDPKCTACATPRPDCMGAVVPGIGDRCGALRLRRFRIECECAGAPFHWTGEAVNEAAAFSCAAHALAVEMPNVAAHQVRLVACIEVAP